MCSCTNGHYRQLEVVVKVSMKASIHLHIHPNPGIKKPPHQLPDETARLVVFRSVRFDLYLIFRGAYRQMEVAPVR